MSKKDETLMERGTRLHAEIGQHWLAIDDGAGFTPDELDAVNEALTLYVKERSRARNMIPALQRRFDAARDLLARVATLKLKGSA